MTQKCITGIYIARISGGPMTGHQRVSLKAGKGIEGDRYFSSSGRSLSSYRGIPDFEVTLVESEVIHTFNKKYGFSFHESAFRRNLITTGVRLNELEGASFKVNGTELFGVRLCEPCASLQRRLAVKILPELNGKGGLRARVLDSGIVSVNDLVTD